MRPTVMSSVEIFRVQLGTLGTANDVWQLVQLHQNQLGLRNTMSHGNYETGGRCILTSRGIAEAFFQKQMG